MEAQQAQHSHRAHVPVPGTLQRRLVVVRAGQGGVQGKVPGNVMGRWQHGWGGAAVAAAAGSTVHAWEHRVQNKVSKEASVRPAESPAPSLCPQPEPQPHSRALCASECPVPEQSSQLGHGPLACGSLLSDPARCSRTLQSCRPLLTATRACWDSHPASAIAVSTTFPAVLRGWSPHSKTDQGALGFCCSFQTLSVDFPLLSCWASQTIYKYHILIQRKPQ